jgi:hypothetical protein
MNYKICNKCSINLPLTQEYFSKHSRTATGFHNYCKPCRAKVAKEYRQNNPDKYKETRLKNYAKCKDKYNATRNFRYHNDPEFRQKKIALDLRRTEEGRRKKENVSEEAWKKHLESAKKSRLKYRDEYLAKCRQYADKNRGLLITIARENRANLSDTYVKKVIQKTFKDDGMHITLSEIPEDFVKLKRKQLNIYRDVKNKKSENRNNF